MHIKTLIHPLRGCSHSLIIFNKTPPLTRFQSSFSPPSLRFITPKILHRGVKTSCISPGKELIFYENGDNSISLSKNEEEEEEAEMEVKRGGLDNQSIWCQIKEIVMFTGPATGLWLCGPLMSLIDTAVVGLGSSIELAALGISFSNIIWACWFRCFYGFLKNCLKWQIQIFVIGLKFSLFKRAHCFG